QSSETNPQLNDFMDFISQTPFANDTCDALAAIIKATSKFNIYQNDFFSGRFNYHRLLLRP
ncbi:25371_t:CDS:2, partial [Racocetra persica]